MDRRVKIAASTGLAVGAVLLAGCGATDVESSDQYLELRDERDAVAFELDEVQAELDDVDDQLAVSDAKRADAEAALADVTATNADLATVLTLDVMNRSGLSRDDADCASDAFLADSGLLQAYVLLLDSPDGSAESTQAAYDQVTAALAACGLQLSDTSETEPAPADLPALADVLGEVEVIGDRLPAYTDAGTDPAVGMAAPVVVGADYDGNAVRIDPAADGPTMVIVLAHWCPHCNAEIPRINQLRDEGRVPDGVNIVAVSSAVSPDRANYPPGPWLDQVDWTFPVLADGVDLATGSFIGSDAYGVAGVPFVTLIDGSGTVVARWAGERDVELLARALTDLAAG